MEGFCAKIGAVMNDPNAPPGEPSPVVFDAVLSPHRSLSPQGFLVLMAAVCAVSFTGGLFFFLAGAWPVVGFLGLDVLLIYFAFKINYRRGRAYETLQLTPKRLQVERVSPKGKVARWSFQPAWLQILMDDPPAHHSQLTLRSHGRSLVVGAFLTPDERLDLAKSLRNALSNLRSV